ncbi:MAG TPA: phosphate ABC transporter substrate-binding protein PstS [Gaiellaceae bacterium]|nr:phosphate ABC transporter substrate-binding protein PstS [Gaiellaceae bacterium]
MPKLGSLTRISAVAAAAALLAATAVGTAGASRASHHATTISGAGSTFVSPLVAQWVAGIGAAYGYELQYSPIGSGGGIAAIQGRTVDFGASDAPLTSDQFAACNGCLQIPWALGGTAVMYNEPSVPNLLHMDGPTLAKIFMGQITTWNDPAIKKLNPKVSLPSDKITIAHRSDNSGTTYNLSDYLSSVSSTWKSRFGTAVAVNWPVGVGAKGSSGVAGVVSSTQGAIGYADVAFALQAHLKYFAMKNRSGKFTTPGTRGILAAASSDQKPDANNALSIVNPPKKYPVAYPISTFTYVIVPKQTAKAAALRKFLFWAVTKGQAAQYTARLRFVPIPKSVLVVAEKTIAKIHS